MKHKFIKWLTGKAIPFLSVQVIDEIILLLEIQKEKLGKK